MLILFLLLRIQYFTSHYITFFTFKRSALSLHTKIIMWTIGHIRGTLTEISLLSLFFHYQAYSYLGKPPFLFFSFYCFLLFCLRNIVFWCLSDISLCFPLCCIHLAVCLTTGPKPLPKWAFQILRSRTSSFKLEYPVLSLSSSNSFLLLLPRFPVASILPLSFHR